MDKTKKMYAKFHFLMLREEGQDLVEYALIIALISLGAISAMSTLATDIATLFTNVGTILTSAVA